MMLQLQFHYKAMVFCTAGQPLFSAHVNVLVDNTIQSACSSLTWLKYFIGICLKCSFEHMESHFESKEYCGYQSTDACHTVEICK